VRGAWSLRLRVYLLSDMGTHWFQLKQALLECCLSHLGPEIIPAEWLNGHLDTMGVEFIHSTEVSSSHAAFSFACRGRGALVLGFRLP
jgi:hypothetical protein